MTSPWENYRWSKNEYGHLLTRCEEYTVDLYEDGTGWWKWRTRGPKREGKGTQEWGSGRVRGLSEAYSCIRMQLRSFLTDGEE